MHLNTPLSSDQHLKLFHLRSHYHVHFIRPKPWITFTNARATLQQLLLPPPPAAKKYKI